MDLDLINYKLLDICELTDKERLIICKSLSLLTNSEIEKVCKEVIFISSNKYTNAWRLELKYIKSLKCMIFLSHHLDKYSKKKKMRIILHEVGHHLLKHKSPIYENLSSEETAKQEKEANKFANKLINKITFPES